MTIETDVLIVGSGLAGGVAALKAAELGAKVLMIEGSDSASAWAQGGIVYHGDHDPKALYDDVMEAGCRRNFVPAVELLCQESERIVEDWLLKKLKVAFDRKANGDLDLALEGAHRSSRILHVKDATGAAIMKALQNEIENKSEIVRVKGKLIDFILTDRHDQRRDRQFSPSRVGGAYVFSTKEQAVKTIVARTVILASGGFSQLYLHSTGPQTSLGDGIAAAHRAGVRTIDLEYVQFHPTSLYVRGKPRRLLTEALRGAGAKLLNLSHKSFVDNLAPRDVVARAIHEELISSGGDHVWLDLREVAELENKFPTIVAMLKLEGIDPLKECVPVVPAAHYTIGGVWTDLDGSTSLPGLYAAGEVACTGLHGANRLASTSLLEALLFGERAAVTAVRQLRLNAPLDFEPKDWVAEKTAVDPALLAQDWQLLKQTMWNYVGLVRSERRLRRAERILVELRTEVESFYKKSQLSNDLIALRNGVLVATLVLYSALRNRESVGTHYLKSHY